VSAGLLPGLDARLAACAEADWQVLCKTELVAGDARRAAEFDAGRDVDALLTDRTAQVDAVLADAYRRDFGALEHLALLATGGFGRGELFPHSDVDILLLCDAEIDGELQPRIERFLTRLWDVGLAPGHAVRSVEECLAEGRNDATVATALLELRPICGDPNPARALARAVRSEAFWSPQAFFEAKRVEQRSRHARYNDTAYNLEPNLKEGPGGLRDLHTLAWMAQRIYGVQRIPELKPLGAIGGDELIAFERERRALSHLRYGLHLVAGRREERLLFDFQRPLAARLGFKDEHADNLAVEQLMQGFFRSAAVVLRLNGRMLQRFEESLTGEPEIEALDEDFAQGGGYLRLRREDAFREDPAKLMTLFQVWANNPSLRGLHSSTARALGEALPAIDEGFRAREDVRAAFVRILRGPQPVASLQRMWQLGVLGRYLPAFGNVSGRMQYDLFHVYTVDQHTLTVLRNIDSFASEDSKQRFALAHDLWPRLRKPELLLLGALFHDIAKGRGGDHSKLGAEDAVKFCLEHGFSAADADLVSWLVREHLTMSVTAQRQDISDPEVIARFAAVVGDRERLDYLYLLTVADIAGTSPKLWNAWKDRLLADLHGATRFALRRGLENRVYADERIAETRAAARMRLIDAGLSAETIERVWAGFPRESFQRYSPEQIAWQTRGIAQVAPQDLPLVLARPHVRAAALEVFVYSHDRDGLFAVAAATLDRLGLSIAEARIVTSMDGFSLDTFQVLDAGMEFVSPERRAATVAESLREALADMPDQIAPPNRLIPRQLRHFRIPVQIEFSQDEAAGRTRMMLVCTDRPGLLARAAAVLRAHRMRLHDARIATFGERVEDFFQLSDEDNRAITDEARLEAVRAALTEALTDSNDKDAPHADQRARA
jgi:[protein-PII] uridylyltransferase